MRPLIALPLLALSLLGCRKEDDTPLDLDGDGYDQTEDCDDTDDSVHPDAPERCDGLDNDCDAAIDEDPIDAATFFADVDRDGYGNPANSTEACAVPEGYVANGDDCDDSSAAFHPGAPEADCADPADYNCDGSVGYADADGDGFAACQECDDSSADRFPGNPEICDEVDNDCDSLVDNDATDATEFFADVDGDGYGDPSVSLNACEAPAGYSTDNTDCDDLAAASHPGGEERCDGLDNDCDGTVDLEAGDAVAWYADSDHDHYGDPSTEVVSCEAPAGYVADGSDCDDAHAAARPGATEVCDGLDNDCDGDADAGAVDAHTWYADADQDGFGDPTTATTTCDPTEGLILDHTDCDDTSADRHPGLDEWCDGLDNDCDGTPDDSATDAGTWYTDEDGDGFGLSDEATRACAQPAATASRGGDCDDTEAGRFPGNPETCVTPLDDDCDGQINEADAADATTWHLDADGDAHGRPGAGLRACEAPEGYVASADDCDDLRAVVYPGAAQLCDGLANDCGALPDDEADADRDGWMPCEGDCQDTQAAINPTAVELCDGLDNNCDEVIDTDAINTLTWFADTDGDGFGDVTTTVRACDPLAGYVADRTDCDDTRAAVHPGAPERCDTPDDDDCDTEVNEDSAEDASTWHPDQDLDGYGDALTSTVACLAPAGWILAAGDCDDGDDTVYTGADERCDPVDHDCDGDLEAGAVDAHLYHPDADGDGFGDADTDVYACELPADHLVDGTDCLDSDVDVFPGSTAPEVPLDGVDTDCDGHDVCTDLNCDGLPDIHIPSYHDGDYNITQPFEILSGPSGLALASESINQIGALGAKAADLDHDGYIDLIDASHYNGSSYNISSYIYWGHQDGHHQADRTALPTNGAHWPCVGDLNGDGWEDVVFAGYQDGDFWANSWIYWSDAGTFSSANATNLTTYGSTHCAIGDVNGDGYPEVAFSSYNDGDYSTSSYLFWGTASGPSNASALTLPTVGAYNVDMRDVDGDGALDLIYWSHYNGSSHHSNNNFIYWNVGGTFSTANRTTLDGYGGFQGIIEDLDQDGDQDVVVLGYYNGAWSNMVPTYIYWGDGTRNYSSANRTEITSRGILSGTADDIDMDGNIDLLLGSHHDGDYSADSMIFWGQPDGSYDNSHRLSLPGHGIEFGTAVRDFDHDGYKDVFLPGMISGTTWSNAAYSRVFWGSSLGISASNYDQWFSRGAWSAVVVGD
ncbi:MAG: VCBS repeat-containing protein [Deltaproteobacteria bacterium]|nr:VCBS repeat-containing protein [Deltaproteobacteria bacterium]